ncbi:twin-arginine translocation signal domain-containing protein, partial [uncultured Pseudomonas sp.]
MSAPDPVAELHRLQAGETVNLSRRRFLVGTAAGALVLGFGLPTGVA